MIDDKVLFVLGAGASKPYGYPTGKELRDYITDKSAHDIAVLLDATSYTEEEKEQIIRDFQKFAFKFKTSSIQSIDQYMAIRNEFAEYGKCTIALNILKSENRNEYVYRINEDCNNWYEYLWHRITKDISSQEGIDKILSYNISFITFNYDRSLEHFFYTRLLSTFGKRPVETFSSALHDKKYPFHIEHVYGKIDGYDHKNQLRYGEKVTYSKVTKCMQNINTIYEMQKNKDSVLADLLLDADRIFFLGFGFAPENLTALNLPAQLTGKRNVFGTTLGFTKKERTELFESLRHGAGLGSSDLMLEDMDAYWLLREYL